MVEKLCYLSLPFFENKGATALWGWDNGSIHMPGPAPGDAQSPLLIIPSLFLEGRVVPWPRPPQNSGQHTMEGPWEAAAMVPPTGDA